MTSVGEGSRAIHGELEPLRVNGARVGSSAFCHQFGGTGQPIPWNLVAEFKPGVHVMLAGGLTPENVAEAIKIVQPYAVDVASGIESVPGRKNLEKMRRFVDNVRAVSKT